MEIFFDFLNVFLQIIQVIGIIVPLIGIIALLKKEQSRVSMFLMLANFACFFINGCYLLMLRATGYDAAMQSLKLEYLGTTLFYFFFVQFILSYFQLRCPNWLGTIWILFEGAAILLLWIDNHWNLAYTETGLEQMQKLDAYYLSFRLGPVFVIRYCYLCAALGWLLVYTLYRMFRARAVAEKKRIARLAGAEFVVITSLGLTLLLRPPYDIVPISSSLAVLAIILSVIKGEFFSVTDRGRQYVFENIRDLFVIVDNEYGYLDSNAYAKRIYPDLKFSLKGDRIPDSLYDIFVSEEQETEIEIEGRYYERNVVPVLQDNEVEGYSLVLIDVTKQHQLVQELKEAKEKAEAANAAKSTFMSNMSHEIRTPMNAIVGMTEILLRSKLPESERGYLNNIRSSGNALLTIINDMLDFSKVEAGKMELVEAVYEPMSMLSDMGMIFLNRIGNKEIELFFEIDKELPAKLYGDALRVRQIIINLINNAVKFTDEGYIKLSIQTVFLDDEEVELHVRVKDTGLGIKEEDRVKIFESFQQVDAKKNHYKEGTGLGLAICKQLVELMGGTIGVDSVYGQGSEFYFTIKQKMEGTERAAYLKTDTGRKLTVSGRMDNHKSLEELKKLVLAYDIAFVDYEALDSQKADFLFCDEQAYYDNAERIRAIQESGTEVCLLQNPLVEDAWDSSVKVVNKPLFSLNFCQVLNHEEQNTFAEIEDYLDFEAPQADILIVDDNEMNLKVAKGLLEPIHMKIDTAENGKQAVQMIQKKQYHLVFMDHMMPIMDGVEAAQTLRNMEDMYYQQLPIIALTANATMDARERFCQAGMNDFVAKPIELKQICAALKKWLPKELLQKKTAPKQAMTGTLQIDATESQTVAQEEALPLIEGLDIAEGIKNCGNQELFVSLLGDFYKVIDIKSSKIEKCLADGMLRDYTIEVHALKNTARMIGALELSEWFYRMEQAGNAEQLSVLQQETPGLMKLYRSYKDILRPYGQLQEQDKEAVPKEKIIELLQSMREAMDCFDLDTVDDAMKKLENCQMPENCQNYMESLRAYVADVAMEEVLDITEQMLVSLGK